MRGRTQRVTVLAAVVAATLATAQASVRAAPPDTSRIVSIGGSTTEILYALGLERQIVAVDSSSLYPPQARREKADVGYMRQLSPEGALGLNPSMIIATEGTGPKETVAVLQSAGVRFVLVPDRFTGEGIVEKINVIAGTTGTDERGACLAKAVSADLAALGKLRAEIKKPLRAMFVLSFLGDRAQVAGRNTAADGIMRLAGATNAITEYDGYKAINDEAIVAARPDFVFAMQRDGN